MTLWDQPLATHPPVDYGGADKGREGWDCVLAHAVVGGGESLFEKNLTAIMEKWVSAEASQADSMGLRG